VLLLFWFSFARRSRCEGEKAIAGKPSDSNNSKLTNLDVFNKLCV